LDSLATIQLAAETRVPQVTSQQVVESAIDYDQASVAGYVGWRDRDKYPPTDDGTITSVGSLLSISLEKEIVGALAKAGVRTSEGLRPNADVPNVSLVLAEKILTVKIETLEKEQHRRVSQVDRSSLSYNTQLVAAGASLGLAGEMSDAVAASARARLHTQAEQRRKLAEAGASLGLAGETITE
jgi:hypothetical protein